MKTEKSNFLGTFVLAKLPNKLTASRWFTVVPQILFQTNTAHFHKGEMANFYSPKSDIQTMPNFTGSWMFNSTFFQLKCSVQRLNGQIHLKSN